MSNIRSLLLAGSALSVLATGTAFADDQEDLQKAAEVDEVITFNANGIRSAASKGFFTWLASQNADVVCIQETKAMKEQVELEALEAAGYHHHYWFSAQKKGYSGVAVLCKTKEKPDFIQTS